MITLIAAIDDNRLIGKDDTLPWHIPADFKHFKAVTLGHPIVMGRKTYDSLPKRPLPGRSNLVVSRRPSPDGLTVFDTIEAALAEGRRESDEVFVIGGQSIYEQTIGIADRLLVTHVDGSFEGNYWFPEIGTRWGEPTILQIGDGFRIADYRLRV
jgi:dihydrofolate reductase